MNELVVTPIKTNFKGQIMYKILRYHFLNWYSLVRDMKNERKTERGDKKRETCIENEGAKQ